jgi:esterase/lipase
MKNTHITANGIDLKYTTNSAPRSTESCVILLPGIPYNPEKEYALIERLNTEQLDTFLIHYEGTWGSSGKFLTQHPKVSIEDFIMSIQDGKITNSANQLYTKIYIIGASFGGGLALTIDDHESLVAVCALSPVITYPSVSDISTLGQYLQESCAEYYNFDIRDMNTLINDEIINPKSQFTLPPEKVLIIAGADDTQIPIIDIKEFSHQYSLRLEEYPTGHITFSKVNEEQQKLIVDHFNLTATSQQP